MKKVLVRRLLGKRVKLKQDKDNLRIGTVKDVHYFDIVSKHLIYVDLDNYGGIWKQPEEIVLYHNGIEKIGEKYNI